MWLEEEEDKKMVDGDGKMVDQPSHMINYRLIYSPTSSFTSRTTIIPIQDIQGEMVRWLMVRWLIVRW